MRKIILFIAILLLLAGCSKKEEPKQPTENTPVEKITTYQYGDLKYSEADILSFLDGEWIQVVAPDQKPATLTFNKERNEIDVRREDGFGVYSTMEFKPLYTNKSSCLALIETHPFNASEKTKMKYGDKFDVYKSYYQFYGAQSLYKDYLLLRETGNGLSIVDAEGLKEETMSPEYTWVFTRVTEYEYPDENLNNQALKKSETFYAYMWGYNEKEVMLQHMAAQQTEVDWYEENKNVYMVEPENGHTGSTIYRYTLSNGVKVKAGSIADMVQSVVLVDTDSKGNITTIEKLAYVGYGYYAKAD